MTNKSAAWTEHWGVKQLILIISIYTVQYQCAFIYIYISLYLFIIIYLYIYLLFSWTTDFHSIFPAPAEGIQVAPHFFFLLRILLDLRIRQGRNDDRVEEVHDDEENAHHVDDNQQRTSQKIAASESGPRINDDDNITIWLFNSSPWKITIFNR